MTRTNARTTLKFPTLMPTASLHSCYSYALGWLSGPELEGLWAVSRGFVFPSLYEGFGLPVLEAMARGVPVACSKASSLPEVAGQAALQFDPYDERAIAQALGRLLEDEALRERLRIAGFERVRLFTWQRTARRTLESYAHAARQAHRRGGVR